MTMKKKDYELVASAFKDALTVERQMMFDQSPSASPEAINTLKTLARRLSLNLLRSDTKFNQSKFLDSCGIED